MQPPISIQALFGWAIAIAVIAFGAYVLLEEREKERTACTLEAKVCPDGVNVVGREGPNCEFARCPGER